MENCVTGSVTGVNGNLVFVKVDGSIKKNEVGFVIVGTQRLKGEIIRVNNGVASMQIYEMTEGIKVGDKVEFTDELMSVKLGPGLLSRVFDGLQNPLPELAEQCGFFLERGVYLDPIPNKDWELFPKVFLTTKLWFPFIWKTPNGRWKKLPKKGFTM